jgi:pimeloyl-ACP methyl ester carboxylesterase
MTRAYLAAATVLVPLLIAAVACGPEGAAHTKEATMQTTQTIAGPTLRMQAARVGSGPPLALIGGGLTGSASWEPHAQRLAATRDVARLQLLSVQYGLEDRPLPEGYSIRTESRALAAALDTLGWHQAVDLAAWSYGAAVTLDFALNHPERVRTLTLIEPPALWVLPDHGRGLSDVRELEALLPDVGDEVGPDVLLRFLRTAALVPPGSDPEALPQWESWVLHRRSLRNGGAVFRHQDDLVRLRTLAAPVLLVTGQGTSPFLRAVHDTLAATLPHARTLELPGAHAPHLVAMDAFLDRLLDHHQSAGSGRDDGKHTVTSRDGTPIAFWRSGSGPPLLLIHGATADHTTTWRFVRPELERHFTVLAMDRRGRGGSGDGPEYDLQREAEDVAAVVEAMGEPVNVLGHSHGALIALEAALRTRKIRRLVLYEGVPLRGTDLFAPGSIQRLEALLEAGDMEAMLVTMFRDVVQMPPEEIELLRSQQDAWSIRLGNARTLPRELRANEGYVFEPDRFRAMRAPTLLLVGADSPTREQRSAEAVARALPDGRVGILAGQQHAAMYAAPALFVAEVLRFLGDR